MCWHTWQREVNVATWLTLKLGQYPDYKGRDNANAEALQNGRWRWRGESEGNVALGEKEGETSFPGFEDRGRGYGLRNGGLL